MRENIVVSGSKDCRMAGATPYVPAVGERVVDSNSFRATVRYVGPVSTAKDPSSVWIGESAQIACATA